ncbi:GlxA family transcriptional regulator, partial [Rhizobium ruizarguesonis]
FDIGELEGRDGSDAHDLEAKIEIEEDRIFIIEGSVWTSAGMTAGLDLALAVVEEDHCFDVARAVSRTLVVYHRRAGG